MSKLEVIAALRELADLSEITDANPYEVMAYRNAARAMDEWSGEITPTTSDDVLKQIEGVGTGIAQIICSLASTGEAEALNEVRSKVPRELPLLLQVPGLGPKRVRTLWRELGIERPSDLKQAAIDGRMATLRGFGAATVEKTLRGLERLESGSKSSYPSQTQHHESRARTRLPQAPKSRGRVWAGTSGFSYPAWRGQFYPKDAATSDLLAHYAKRLKSVEINNTFYRFPKSHVIEQWVQQTPTDFRFAIKAHKRITHLQRLNAEAHASMIDFVQQCGQLGRRLGCILFQLPPNFSRDDDRLSQFLQRLPKGPRYAIEFRHDSWFASDVMANLRQSNVALVAGDSENEAPRKELTADFAYVRLRREEYGERELDDWGTWLLDLMSARKDVLIYIKHDEDGSTIERVLRQLTQPRASVTPSMLPAQLASPPRKSRRKSG